MLRKLHRVRIELLCPWRLPPTFILACLYQEPGVLTGSIALQRTQQTRGHRWSCLETRDCILPCCIEQVCPSPLLATLVRCSNYRGTQIAIRGQWRIYFGHFAAFLPGLAQSFEHIEVPLRSGRPP
jgi:hypothetical protein